MKASILFVFGGVKVSDQNASFSRMMREIHAFLGMSSVYSEQFLRNPGVALSLLQSHLTGHGIM